MSDRALPFAIFMSIMSLLLSPVLPSAVAADSAAVRNVVEGLNTTLLDVMQSAEELGYEGRYQKLDLALRGRFDFAFMTKIATGRVWNDLDAGQRDALIERFARMSIATFASRFKGYSGEHFEIIGQEQGRRGTVVVDNQLIRPKDPAVGLNFVLRERAEGTAGEPSWLIIDVKLDGKFSELARQRAEFSAVLKRGGYDELLTTLDERILALGSEG